MKQYYFPLKCYFSRKHKSRLSYEWRHFLSNFCRWKTGNGHRKVKMFKKGCMFMHINLLTWHSRLKVAFFGVVLLCGLITFKWPVVAAISLPKEISFFKKQIYQNMIPPSPLTLIKFPSLINYISPFFITI